MNEPFHMWPYWRDKYGHLDAVKDYFAEELKSNVELQQAVAMVKNGERLIDTLFAELAEREDGVEEDG